MNIEKRKHQSGNNSKERKEKKQTVDSMCLEADGENHWHKVHSCYNSTPTNVDAVSFL